VAPQNPRKLQSRVTIGSGQVSLITSSARTSRCGGNAPLHAPDNGLSKKIANHEAAVALHFLHYNFCRVHQTLRVTPAMEAGISSHVWSIVEIIGLLDAADKKAA
jgi:hypothetical protein